MYDYRRRRVPIKYLGSKRRLVGVLGTLFSASGGGRALDLFTGTTRVAQELKTRGGIVTAVDRARYAHVCAQSAIATDARTVDGELCTPAHLRPPTDARSMPLARQRRKGVCSACACARLLPSASACNAV